MRKAAKVTLTGPQLRRLRAAHKFSQARFAALLGIHSNTLARYERDELPIPEPIARLAKLLRGGSR